MSFTPVLMERVHVSSLSFGWFHVVVTVRMETKDFNRECRFAECRIVTTKHITTLYTEC
jgi:hypothetical protein